MATVSVVQYISPHKNILQQTNSNVPAGENIRLEAPKRGERNIIILRRKKDTPAETENRESELDKLRSVRLVSDKSSHKTVIKSLKSEASSDEDMIKVAKVRPIVPNYVTNSDNGMYRKPRQYKETSSQSVKNVKPPTISIARRNARERNRVKQVNEGFCTLRNRIPEYISGGYNEEKGRKNTKKLSKVETLRMAVDYIRHLEVLLDFKEGSASDWLTTVKTENLTWNTSGSSTGYPSPVDTEYQVSPNTPFDQSYIFPERQLYDYSLEQEISPAKMTLTLANPEPPRLEFLDKIKEECDNSSEVDVEDLSLKPGEENMEEELEDELSAKHLTHPPLPSINETFHTRKLSAFYDSRQYIPYQLINLSKH